MSKRRSLIKTITWRAIASTDTLIIAFFVVTSVTDPIKAAGLIAGIEVINKLVLYYLHERAWAFATNKGWIS